MPATGMRSCIAALKHCQEDSLHTAFAYFLNKVTSNIPLVGPGNGSSWGHRYASTRGGRISGELLLRRDRQGEVPKARHRRRHLGDEDDTHEAAETLRDREDGRKSLRGRRGGLRGRVLDGHWRRIV